jgi:hypothetical protein
MDRTRLNAILFGQRTLATTTPPEKLVIVANDEVTACAEALTGIFTKRTAARPMVLESSQLPAIF